jgi:pimeloyl-ACP methyl ester carboxylesterase
MATFEPGLRSRATRLAGDEQIFGLALLAIALHALVASGSARLALLAVPLAPPLFVLYRSRGRLVRALLAGAIGLGVAAPGLAHHLPRLVLASAHADDYSGVLLALAGTALVALAFHTALRGTRARLKLLAIPTLLVLGQWYAIPLVTAGLATNTTHARVASASTLGLPGARDVSLTALDGVRLAGWYVPSRNGAAVILLHGSHGTRAGTIHQLRLLAGAGYGVLAVDARGHGRSEGQTNALGWKATPDVAGAVDFLRRMPGVNPQRIAAFGLSMGAEEALRASAEGVPLAAVVADGAGASTTGDGRIAEQGALPQSVSWVTMRASSGSLVMTSRRLSRTCSASCAPRCC